MRKTVSIDEIEIIDPFPYDWEHWNYPSSLLHSIYYAPDHEDLPLLGEGDTAVIFDYDGLIEWFLSWKDTDEIFNDMNPVEWITYHLGRTISPVRFVQKEGDA